MLVPLVLTVLTQPAPLVEKATEAAVSAQLTPPTEKAAGETAPPTEKWVTGGCDWRGCATTNHLTGTTTLTDYKGGKITTNEWTGQTTASNHQGSITSNKYTGNWQAQGCSGWGCGTAGGNKFTGEIGWSGNPTICQHTWAQCGGNSWTGATCCEAGSVCTWSSAWYSDCKPSRNYLRKIDEAGELVATHAGVFAATGAFAAIFLAFGLLRHSRASKPDAATAGAPAMQLV